MLFLNKPRYYETPDGHAPFDKIESMAKKGLLFSVPVALADSVFITDTKNAIQTLNCFAYWVVPCVSIGATWAAVTFMATKIRGKDDYVNYAIGALSCAPILWAWRKNTEYTLWGTSILTAAAILAKNKQEWGWEIGPTPKHCYGNYMYDMTLIKEYDRDYRSPYLPRA